MSPEPDAVRHLVFVLGDQLDPESAAFEGFDPGLDAVLMAEVSGEIRRFPNHKQRVVLFLSAMRHLREELRGKGVRVRYRSFTEGQGEDEAPESLAGALTAAVGELEPERVILLEPGRHGLLEELRGAAGEVPLEVREDRHFLLDHQGFEGWAKGRRSLVMETFYRFMRKRTGVLMAGGEPVGERWNFDPENREAFGKEGPGETPEPKRFAPDEITRRVMEEVEEHCGDLPGSLESFAWPVTRGQAREALEDFIAHRLPSFGTHQDAMWTGRPWLYHSLLSPALNLELLDPREVLEAAVAAHEAGDAPLNAVEGFVRQILGWREFLRGIYWLRMPEYLERNALDADRDLPELYWTGDTRMACLADVVGQLLDHGYAHHIQRLMVAGLYALLFGARPREVHDWFMALYVDSVEWVTLPNTVGMSQWADGGVVGTKPYTASGNYVSRMSNYCGQCPFDPKQATGDDACPFTTLYWDFLARHRERLEGNHRMGFQLKNLDRKDRQELAGIRGRAAAIRDGRITP